MAVSTSADSQAVTYRYFVCDLMSNELLAEIPFKNVSYSKSVVEAGVFSGDIAVIPDTYNLSLYENTLPGKTALYVVRNNVCVWGGIIWGRTYSLVDKVLSINAAEFTSYLSHRVVWKTWNSAYEAKVVVSSGTATITLANGQYGFEVGEAVWLDWGTEFAKYNGYFAVLTAELDSESKSVITVEASYTDATGAKKTIPNLTIAEDEDGELQVITVETRQDTYEYARDLLTELTSDLYDFDFANDEIRPGIDMFSPISKISRTSNVATVELFLKHELVVGQKVSVTDIESSIGTDFNNPEAIVSSVLSDKIFTYENEGANVSANTLTSLYEYTITNASRANNIAGFTTSTDHELTVGDIILIENVSETLDGYHRVYEVPSDTVFRSVIPGDKIKSSPTDTSVPSKLPKVTRRAAITYGTFGEYTTLGDIGLDFSDSPTSSGKLEANPVIRGFQLKTVAEILEEYATKPNGFEYRVDCEYDSTSNSFKKKFKFLPLIPEILTEWLQDQPTGYSGAIPASAYGADRFIFEFPGNVLEAQFEENAEDAATRFFVQGKSEYLSSDASQPYSGAGNHVYLNNGWPILDAVDDMDSDDEVTLWKQASRLLQESLPPISTFTISVNGSAHPELGTYSPGDWCTVKLNDDFVSLRADSNLEQDYGTDNGALVRKIESFSVNVPDTNAYPEEVQLELVIEPAIPISGITVLDGKAFLE